MPNQCHCWLDASSPALECALSNPARRTPALVPRREPSPPSYAERRRLQADMSVLHSRGLSRMPSSNIERATLADHIRGLRSRLEPARFPENIFGLGPPKPKMRSFRSSDLPVKISLRPPRPPRRYESFCDSRRDLAAQTLDSLAGPASYPPAGRYLPPELVSAKQT